MNRAGVGIITLNYGNYTAAERYRALITSCSNDKISFATYPATEVLKRYAITAYIHPGLKHIPTKMLAQVFKGYVYSINPVSYTHLTLPTTPYV